MRTLSIITALAAVAAASPVDVDVEKRDCAGLMATCDYQGIDYSRGPDDPYLYVNCKSTNGQKFFNQVALNSVLANNWGHISYAPGGNFGYSCHGCYPYSAGMHCNCDDGNGGVVNDSWYDFNEHFCNMDGTLRTG